MDKKLIEKIIKFRDDRNWSQYHNSKDLAISISLEANELLELFQWNSSEETVNKNLNEIKDELADVLIYSILLSDKLDIDINQIVENKLDKNAKKYPVEKAYNSKEKYDELK